MEFPSAPQNGEFASHPRRETELDVENAAIAQAIMPAVMR
jgi:hypothetical protein